MGYQNRAFIGNRDTLAGLAANFPCAVLVELGQGVFLIPLVDELFDEMNNYIESPSIHSFHYLTAAMESALLNLAIAPLAYIEADYFGGTGAQHGIIWKSKCSAELLDGKDPINQILRYFGVIKRNGQDEFDTVGLGRYRQPPDWLD